MKVLITGAAGYVGRYLAWKLENEHELRLADVMPIDDTRIPWVYGALNVERTPAHTPRPSATLPFIQGNITDYDYCQRITEGMDAVIHLGGHVRHDETVDCFTVNAVGTFCMLEACAKNGIQRALCASSINASGLFYCRATDRRRDFAYLPVDEDIPTDHEDAYSLAKYCNELNCRAWTNRTGMTTAAFRFSGVFPPEWSQVWAERVKPTEAWPEDLASYVDLRDVVGGLKQALECPTLPKTGVYQLSAPDTQLPEPTMEIVERFRPEWLARVREPLTGRASFLSWQRAHEAFGYTPQHSWMAD